MAEVLNANPTILSISDLPSRQGRLSKSLSRKGSLGLLSSTIPLSAYTPDPFSTPSTPQDSDEDDLVEPIDEQEIYGIAHCHPCTACFKPVKHFTDGLHLIADLISPITDPEHPLTLGSLSVVNLPDIHIKPLARTPSLTVVTVLITPTITHCSLATVIGLGVRVRLEQALPPRFRVDVKIKEGTHSTAEAVTRQLSDKERVAAAMENESLVGVIRKMLEGCH